MRIDSPKMNIARRACLKAAKSLIREIIKRDEIEL